MNSATIVLAMGWLLASGPARLRIDVAVVQTASAQQSSQPDAGPASAVPTPPPPSAQKPCPTTSPSTTAPPPDCKPVPKKHKRRKPPVDPDTGPPKNVVRDGSTSEPDVAIAPGVSEQQASQQRETTNQLLAKTKGNLKIIESRQLNAAQKDTVKQVRSYIKQSGDATRDGDVQRAYTLANKARMLSGDLLKH